MSAALSGGKNKLSPSWALAMPGVFLIMGASIRRRAASGGADWLVVTLVPLVASAIELLQKRLAELNESGAPRPDTLIDDLVTPAKVEEMAQRVNSLHAREQAAAIARALRVSLAARLGRFQLLRSENE